ncbi:MAG: pre-peptidase C-terminal domain-containing protein [Planctomycetes bacterium]|nr:pre-peptidase C-terminal domain-containing protein [Planctomycetota bacterium]
MQKLSILLATLAASVGPVFAQTVVPEGPEPNDPNGTPTPIACYDQGQGAIDVAGDDDAWTFTLATPMTVQLTVTPGFTGGIGDSRVELFDSLGTSIGFNDDGGDGLHPLLTINLAAGTYTANVDGFGSATGSYTLDIVCYIGPGSLCSGTLPTVAEGAEPNNDPNAGGTPTVINVCEQGLGDVNPAGDSDWWQIQVTAPITLSLETGPGASTPISDTTLRLRDATGLELAFDDDGGNGLYSLITYAVTPGTYYADVQGFGSNVGQYTLDVTALSSVTLVNATYATSGAGCLSSAGSAVTISPRTNERPYVGSVFVVQVSNIPGSVAYAILGFIDLIPPVDLGIIGAPGCLQYTDLALGDPLNVTAGSAEWYLPIPYLPGLQGIPFNQQVVALDAAANGLGAITSNFGEGVFGDRY